MPETPPSAGSTTGRDFLLFASLWVVVPAIFRVAMLVDWWGTGVPTATLGSVLLGVLLGLVQDLFIAFQALIVMLVARRWLPGRAWLWITGLLLTAYTVWALFDVLLYYNIDLRMTSSFFHFMLDAEVFWDSVEDAGLTALLAGMLLVVVGVAWTLYRLRPRLERLRLESQQALVGMGLGLGAIASVVLGPGELMYMSNNPALSDEVDAVRVFLGVDDPLLSYAEDLDGDTLVLPPFVNEEITDAPDDEYPLYRQTAAYTGPKRFDVRVEANEKPHVLLFVMESFRGRDIGVLGGQHPVTPEFDRLSRDGVLFRSFYACGIQTTRAVVSLLFGVPPRFTDGAVQADASPPSLVGLADILAAEGYATAYLHNGELDFERMGPFFEAHGFDDVVGHLDMLEQNPDAASFSWGVHDEYLVDVVLDWIEDRDQQGVPAFVTSFTISNHHPWELPPHWDPIDIDVSPDETHGKFLRAMHYSDAALGALIDGLRARGLAENTIVLITADTSQAMGDRYESYNVSRALFEENVHVPLLILADGRLQPAVVDAPASQIDVLPTMLDMLHIGARHHSLGTSLMRPAPEHQAVFYSPFALRYQGLREGTWKYWYVLRSQTHHLYDMAADPGETNNLAGEQPERVERFYRDLARRHRLVRTLYDQDRFAP